MMLENEALVLNGACGISSVPLSSYILLSASRNKAFKWLPSASGVLTVIKNEKKLFIDPYARKNKSSLIPRIVLQRWFDFLRWSPSGQKIISIENVKLKYCSSSPIIHLVIFAQPRRSCRAARNLCHFIFIHFMPFITAYASKRAKSRRMDQRIICHVFCDNSGGTVLYAFFGALSVLSLHKQHSVITELHLAHTNKHRLSVDAAKCFLTEDKTHAGELRFCQKWWIEPTWNGWPWLSTHERLVWKRRSAYFEVYT